MKQDWLLHRFIRYKFVSYGKQRLPHSSGEIIAKAKLSKLSRLSHQTRLSPEECGKRCLPYETNL